MTTSRNPSAPKSSSTRPVLLCDAMLQDCPPRRRCQGRGKRGSSHWSQASPVRPMDGAERLGKQYIPRRGEGLACPSRFPLILVSHSSQRSHPPAPSCIATLEPTATIPIRVRCPSPLRPWSASVVVHGGIYRLEHSLEFNAADSGTEMSPVVWKPAPGETVATDNGDSLENDIERSHQMSLSRPVAHRFLTCTHQENLVCSARVQELSKTAR